MSKLSFFKKPLGGGSLIVIALFLGAGIVYAYNTLNPLGGISGLGFRLPHDSTYYSVTGNNSVTANSQNDARNIKNTGSKDLFAPSKTSTEWNDFLNHAPNISVTSGSTCTYAWSPVYTICADTNNNPPYQSNSTSDSTCSASNVNKYLTVGQATDMTCNVNTPTYGDHTHYNYEVCTPSCSSNSPVNGICGPAATGYSSGASFPSGAYCTVGAANPSSPADPAAGGSTPWTCQGSNGGNDIACTATRASITYSWTSYSGTCTAPPSNSSATCDASSVGKYNSVAGIQTVPLSCPGNQPKFTYQVCTQN